MTKTAKIVIPSITIALAAALAGSISGTVAWYQYSTRANVAYLGTSGGTSGNLQMRIKGTDKWITRLTVSDIDTYLHNSGFATKLMPITAGAVDKDGALPSDFYVNPVAGRGPYAKWLKASTTNYVQIPLELRYVERDGVYTGVNGDGQKFDEQEVARDVYLSDLLIQEDRLNEEGKSDLSDAIRFHISSYQTEVKIDSETSEMVLDDNNQPIYVAKAGSSINRLISKNGGTTIVEGKLDLDGDGELDKGYVGGDDKYGDFGRDDLVDIIYGKNFPYTMPDPEDPEADPIPTPALKQTAYHARKNNFDLVNKENASYYDAENVEQVEEEDIYPAVVKSNTANLDLEKLSYTPRPIVDENDPEAEPIQQAPVSKKIGTTIENDPNPVVLDDGDEETEDISFHVNNYLNIVITIWVEGWQKFDYELPENELLEENPAEEKISSIWNATYAFSSFDVGFEFGVDSDANTL